MISFSSVSSVYFPCISSRICFKRSILRTKHENKKNKKRNASPSQLIYQIDGNRHKAPSVLALQFFETLFSEGSVIVLDFCL
jgi:hypothetical protein